MNDAMDWAQDQQEERDKRILMLARKVYNRMGFACQGAEQQNEAMQIRYELEAQAAMRELEELLGDGGKP